MKQTNYKTKQKSAIMNCIKGMKDKHFTVDSICKKLNDSGNVVGRTTVYRFFEKLTEEGTLRKFVMPQGESSCYQFVGENTNCADHFHLKCEKCGCLIHMDCDEMRELVKHIKSHHSFYLNPLKTVIYGLCEDCVSK